MLTQHVCGKSSASPEELHDQLLGLIIERDNVKEASRLLCKGAPIESVASGGNSPLRLAVILDRCRTTNLLLACGAMLPANLLQDAWQSPDVTSGVLAALTAAVCREARIQQRLGSPYHPRSRAQVERQNQLMDNLRCLCTNNIDQWPEMVPHLQFSHNSSTEESQHQLVGCVTSGVPQDRSNAEAARRLVQEKTRKIQRAVRTAKERIALAQMKVGKLVCLKFSNAERRFKGVRKSPLTCLAVTASSRCRGEDGLIRSSPRTNQRAE